MPGFNILQISQLPLLHESYLVQHRQLISTLNELIYHVMSLDYGKLYVEVWVTLLLAQVTFVHADAPSLAHQKQYLTLGGKSILG